MIPVKPEPEPDNFDELVRQPGGKYLGDNPDAKASDLPPLWREVLPDLWEKYHGVCAYLAIFFERPTGAASVDHFVPKSKSKDLAYEWSNYRLATLGENQKKHTHEVLDPFELEQDSFFINFADGEMYPNPEKEEEYKNKCRDTIELLELNSPDCTKMRIRHYEEYTNHHVDLDYLSRNSPFVHHEIVRQRLQ